MIKQFESLPPDLLGDLLAACYRRCLAQFDGDVRRENETSPNAKVLADSAEGEESNEKPEGDSLSFPILAHE